MKKIIALFGSALLLVALASVALAHAQIASCTPPINGTVDTAPATLTCTTTEGMVPDKSSLSVFDASGAQVDKGDSAVDLNNADRNTISVSLDTSKMPNGVYTVKWETLSADDGDDATGTFNFTVGPAATPSAGTFNGKINIVDPAPDDTLVAGPVEISVSVDGVTLGDTYHWHLYVDGQEVTMVMEGKSAYTTNLTAGKHTIKVSLADATNDELTSATQDINVLTPEQATAAAPTGEATAEATTAPAATTPTAEATMEMQMTPTAEATTAPAATQAAPAASPTASAPQTLPTTGGNGGSGTGALIALLAVLLLGFGAFVTVRARK